MICKQSQIWSGFFAYAWQSPKRVWRQIWLRFWYADLSALNFGKSLPFMDRSLKNAGLSVNLDEIWLSSATLKKTVFHAWKTKETSCKFNENRLPSFGILFNSSKKRDFFTASLVCKVHIFFYSMYTKKAYFYFKLK